jgi:hypothetical protein
VESALGASFVVLIPVLEDWAALAGLLPRLARAADAVGARTGVLIVDDGSLETPEAAGVPGEVEGLSWIRVLRLRRNLGHQRAIAVGLCFIDEQLDCDAVIVMDGDGEDRPEDIPALVERARREPGSPIVFGERQRRVEGLVFRVFYLLYRMLHRPLTGRGVKVGNFSLVPRVRVESLAVVSELWIHYAASVVRSRQPWCSVPVTRDRRLQGRSRMTFVSLVVHGLSAISVYSDVVFTRLVMATSMLAGMAIGGLLLIAALRLSAAVVVPGWLSSTAGILVLVLLQAVTFGVSLVFVVLGSRQLAPIIPRRDYRHYVSSLTAIASLHSDP